MADDPIGTVRREEHEGGYSIWQRLHPNATPGNEWMCVWSTVWQNIEATLPHGAAGAFPVIGAVPGTSAAAGLLAAPAPSVDLVARIRQIIADHCFGPHDTKAREERALDIASACTDDMVDEGLLAAPADARLRLAYRSACDRANGMREAATWIRDERDQCAAALAQVASLLDRLDDSSQDYDTDMIRALLPSGSCGPEGGQQK